MPTSQSRCRSSRPRGGPVLRFSSPAPKGQPHISPGQRPGKRIGCLEWQRPERARQCVVKNLVSPFQGWVGPHSYRVPGRCPGLFCFGPFGATQKRDIGRLGGLNHGPIGRTGC